jgi:hypothetical protein
MTGVVAQARTPGRPWPLASVEVDVPVDLALRAWVHFREGAVPSPDVLDQLIPDHAVTFRRLDAWRSRITLTVDAEPQGAALGPIFGLARSEAAGQLARFRAFVAAPRANGRQSQMEDDHGSDPTALPRSRGASPGPGRPSGQLA